MFQLRILLRLGLALALVLTLGAGRASASIGTETYELTTSNLSGSINNNSPFTGPFATVTVDLLSNTQATITFHALADANYQYLFHSNGAVAVNVNGAFSLDTTLVPTASNTFPGFTAGPASDGSSGNEDGYGSFNQTITLFDGFQHSATDVSFTVDATGSNSWANAGSVISSAAAQIGPWVVGQDGFAQNLNTGFAGDAVPTTGPPPPVDAVPEPSTMALATLGGLGFLGYGLRRRLKK